jgi:hypothetical protein
MFLYYLLNNKHHRRRQPHHHPNVTTTSNTTMIAEDVLNDAKGECVICLEELLEGDIIARLPCLCIYHKG